MLVIFLSSKYAKNEVVKKQIGLITSELTWCCTTFTTKHTGIVNCHGITTTCQGCLAITDFLLTSFTVHVINSTDRRQETKWSRSQYPGGVEAYLLTYNVSSSLTEICGTYTVPFVFIQNFYSSRDESIRLFTIHKTNWNELKINFFKLIELKIERNREHKKIQISCKKIITIFVVINWRNVSGLLLNW